MKSSSWGRRPQTPGIYRIPARMTERGGRSLHLRSFRPLSRRSGCVPAVPYPPLRSSQSGLLQPRRAMIYQRTAITPLTSCLTPGVQFKYAPLRAYPLPLRKGNVAKIGSTHASRIKLHCGLNISRAVTTSAIPGDDYRTPLESIFITIGGPQGHGHSITVAARNRGIPSRDCQGAVLTFPLRQATSRRKRTEEDVSLK